MKAPLYSTLITAFCYVLAGYFAYAPWVHASSFQPKMCNNTPFNIYTYEGYSTLKSDKIYVDGWYSLKPGECFTWRHKDINYPVDQFYYGAETDDYRIGIIDPSYKSGENIEWGGSIMACLPGSAFSKILIPNKTIGRNISCSNGSSAFPFYKRLAVEFTGTNFIYTATGGKKWFWYKKLTKNFSHERFLVLSIQLLLKEIMYNPGKIDGFLGPHTKYAIKEFMTDNNIKGALTSSKLQKVNAKLYSLYSRDVQDKQQKQREIAEKKAAREAARKAAIERGRVLAQQYAAEQAREAAKERARTAALEAQQQNEPPPSSGSSTFGLIAGIATKAMQQYSQYRGAMSGGTVAQQEQAIQRLQSQAIQNLTNPSKASSQYNSAYGSGTNSAYGSGTNYATQQSSGYAAGCHTSLAYLADKLPVYNDPQLTSMRNEALNTNLNDVLQKAQSQGYTKNQAAQLALKQAQAFEKREPQAEACVVQTASDPNAELQALRSGTFDFNGYNSLNEECARAYVAFYYGLVANKATAVGLACLSGQ